MNKFLSDCAKTVLSILLILSIVPISNTKAAAEDWNEITDQAFREDSYRVNDFVEYNGIAYFQTYKYDSQVNAYKYDGTDITLITQDFIDDGYEQLVGLGVGDNNTLYGGFHNASGEPEIWTYDGTTWEQAPILIPASFQRWEYFTGFHNSLFMKVEVDNEGSEYRGYIFDGSTWDVILDSSTDGISDPYYLDIYKSVVLEYDEDSFGMAFLTYNTDENEYIIYGYDEELDQWLEMASEADDTITDIAVYQNFILYGTTDYSNPGKIYAISDLTSGLIVDDGLGDEGGIYPTLSVANGKLYAAMSNISGGNVELNVFDDQIGFIKISNYIGENFSEEDKFDAYSWVTGIWWYNSKLIVGAGLPGEGPYDASLWNFEYTTNNLDGDPTDSSIEIAAPNDGDANNDGIADYTQSYVTSFINPITSEYSVLEVPDSCSVDNVSITPESNNSVQDIGHDYPSGLLNFTIDCGEPGFEAEIKIYSYGMTTTDGYILKKYNSNLNSYTYLEDAELEIQTIGGESALVATYTVIDGGELDMDGTENGIIVDPIGIASAGISSPNTGFGEKKS